VEGGEEMNEKVD
jgi:hypothetical protein